MAAEERLREILKELEGAMVHGSTAADVFARHTAPEYVFTSPSGVVNSRDQVLDGLREGTVHFTSYSMHDLECRFYGDVAIVLGRAQGDGLNPGGERFHGAYRFTSVWRETAADWKLLAWQATGLADLENRSGTGVTA